jgi:hypothetical protein
MALFGPPSDIRDPSGVVTKLRDALDEKAERLASINALCEQALEALAAGLKAGPPVNETLARIRDLFGMKEGVLFASWLRSTA